MWSGNLKKITSHLSLNHTQSFRFSWNSANISRSSLHQYYQRPVVYYLLFIICCLLFVVYYLLFIIRFSNKIEFRQKCLIPYFSWWIRKKVSKIQLNFLRTYCVKSAAIPVILSVLQKKIQSKQGPRKTRGERWGGAMHPLSSPPVPV